MMPIIENDTNDVTATDGLTKSRPTNITTKRTASEIKIKIDPTRYFVSYVEHGFD
jgi:hypothetical protein